MKPINNQKIFTDEQGFLKNPQDWNSDIAIFLAKSQKITLNDNHWEIIHKTREFYLQYGFSLSQRLFVKYIKKTFGEEKGNSHYLMKLFLSSPARTVALIAGIPKPDHCF